MKRMKKILLALLVMALLLITACSSGSEKSASATEAVYDKVEYPAEEEWAEPLPTAEPSLTGSGRDQPQAHPQCIHDAGNAAL